MRGARRPGFRLSRSGQVLQRSLLDEFAGRLAPAATRIGRAFAPHASGKLERELYATVGSRGGRITVTLHSPVRSEEGYAYTPVTRFGHAVAVIKPKRARALRFEVGGQVVFARQVKGYRPAGDWVDPAAAAIDAEVERAEDRIGRQIVSRLL